MKIAPGTYKAHIKSYGVGKPKDGKRPPIFVEFELDTEEKDNPPVLTWYGQMSDSTKPGSKKHPYEITIETLLKLGLKGNDPYAVAENKAGILNTIQEYEVVVEDNEYNGKINSRIRYINFPRNREVLSYEDAKVMAGYNFSGAVLAARQASGIQDQPVKEGDDDDMDIPF